MGNLFDPNEYGHAAGKKNGQELGIENELIVLECIKTQGWVREYELHLITGLSLYTVGQVSRRLADKKQIYRERFAGNAGFFLRLLTAGAERVDGQSGKDITIPASWPHHALAIQTLHYLAGINVCNFETEASLRHQQQTGKLPDGRLISGNVTYFEQERARKSGKLLQNQSQNIVKLAAGGTVCYVAYPFPAAMCGGIDHETRQTNSIRKHLKSNDKQNIKLVRCYFDSLLSYQNMHVHQFKIINLPGMVKTADSQKLPHAIAEKKLGLQWEMIEHYDEYNDIKHISAVLKHNGEFCVECVFKEATFEETHTLTLKSGKVIGICQDMEQTFSEFVDIQKKYVEEDALNGLYSY